MATQGIVSIRHNGKMLFKVVAGSDGMKAQNLAAMVRGLTGTCSAEEVYDLAVSARFGDPDTDLIVQGRESALFFDRNEISEEDLGPLYRDPVKFNDAKFNPRWECGLADCIEVVDLV